MRELILASTSIYRKQQLERLQVSFTAQSPMVDEEPIKQRCHDHQQLAAQLSMLKAKSVSANHSDAIVIGGDQVASFNGTILSKPKNQERAFDQLRAMAGGEHHLYTALTIVCGLEEYQYSCVATMKMRALSDEQIRRYIEADKPFDSCGSYRLESLGISLFETIICEDYTSIIGIPLMWTARTLTQLGVIVP